MKLSVLIVIPALYGYVIRLVPVCDSQRITGAPLAQFVNPSISNIKTSVEGIPAYNTNINECKPVDSNYNKSYGYIGSTNVTGRPIQSSFVIRNHNPIKINHVDNTFRMNGKIKPVYVQPQKPQVVVPVSKPVVVPVPPKVVQAPIVVPAPPKVVPAPLKIVNATLKVVTAPPKVVQSPLIVVTAPPKVVTAPPKVVQAPPKVVQAPVVIPPPPQVKAVPAPVVVPPPPQVKVVPAPVVVPPPPQVKVVSAPVVVPPPAPVKAVPAPVITQQIVTPQIVTPQIFPLYQQVPQPIYQPVYPIIFQQNPSICSDKHSSPTILQGCPPVKKQPIHTITEMTTFVNGSGNLRKISSKLSSSKSSKGSCNQSNLSEKKSEIIHESLEDSSSSRRVRTKHIEIEDASSYNFIELRNFCNMNIDPKIRECEKHKLSSLLLDTERISVSYHVIGRILQDKGIRIKDLIKYTPSVTVEELRRLNETINRAFEMSKKLKENEQIICNVSSEINICYTALYNSKKADKFNIQQRRPKDDVFNLNEKSLEDSDDYIKHVVTIKTRNNEPESTSDDGKVEYNNDRRGIQNKNTKYHDDSNKDHEDSTIQYRKPKPPTFIDLESDLESFKEKEEDEDESPETKYEDIVNKIFYKDRQKDRIYNVLGEAIKSKIMQTRNNKSYCDIGSLFYNSEECLKVVKMSDLIKGKAFDPCLDFFKHRINQISKGNFAYCSMREPHYRENGDTFVYLSEII